MHKMYSIYHLLTKINRYDYNYGDYDYDDCCFSGRNNYDDDNRLIIKNFKICWYTMKYSFTNNCRRRRIWRYKFSNFSCHLYIIIL